MCLVLLASRTRKTHLLTWMQKELVSRVRQSHQRQAGLICKPKISSLLLDPTPTSTMQCAVSAVVVAWLWGSGGWSAHCHTQASLSRGTWLQARLIDTAAVDRLQHEGCCSAAVLSDVQFCQPLRHLRMRTCLHTWPHARRCVCTRAFGHTHARTRTHARTHARIHTHTYAYTHKRTHARMHSHDHTHVPDCAPNRKLSTYPRVGPLSQINIRQRCFFSCYDSVCAQAATGSNERPLGGVSLM
jgi:hypothetical protein